MSSSILFAVYIDGLLKELREARLGYHIDGVYFGALVFADDVLPLSDSRCGLQAIFDICNVFSAKRNLKFGTNYEPFK